MEILTQSSNNGDRENVESPEPPDDSKYLSYEEESSASDSDFYISNSDDSDMEASDQQNDGDTEMNENSDGDNMEETQILSRHEPSHAQTDGEWSDIFSATSLAYHFIE